MVIQLELTQLKYFQAAAEECNFTRAARRLNISQPALSKAIQNLEDEIEVKLFVRDGNKIALSPYGRSFLEEVNSAILHLDEGIRNTRIQAGLDYGHIAIAISGAITITKPIEYFLIEHPNVYFHELPTTNLQMEDRLLDGTIDFGITYDPIDNPKIVWQPIYQDRMSVLLPHNHRLAGQRVIQLEELTGERVLQGDNFGKLSFVRDFYYGSVFSPKIVYEGTDKGMVGRLVSAGVGIAFAPLSVSLSLHRYEEFPYRDGAENLAYVPLVDDFWHKSIGVVHLRDHYISRAAQALLDRIIAFYDDLPPAF